MDIKELYYINKWKPMYNIINKQKEEMCISIDESQDNWIVFVLHKHDKEIGTIEKDEENKQSENVKRKAIYFNLDDEDEALLFERANEIKNFSKWIKKQIDLYGTAKIEQPQKFQNKTQFELQNITSIELKINFT